MHRWHSCAAFTYRWPLVRSVVNANYSRWPASLTGTPDHHPPTYVHVFIHCWRDTETSIPRLLTLQSAEAVIVPRRLWSWYTGRWWVDCYIWYSDEGTGRGRSPPRPRLAVPNVTAHPPTASVPITVQLYDGPLLCSFNMPVKGLTRSSSSWSPGMTSTGSWLYLCTTVVSHVATVYIIQSLQSEGRLMIDGLRDCRRLLVRYVTLQSYCRLAGRTILHLTLPVNPSWACVPKNGKS